MHFRGMKTLLLFMLAAVGVSAQQTVGVLKHNADRSFTGYTLFAPVTSKTTYLIDNDGDVVKTWLSQYGPGQAVMLLNDGTLLRTGTPSVQDMGGGGAGGIVEKFSWDGQMLWRYEHYGSTYRSHHDVEIMPNGNILLLVWESHSRSEAFDQGRDSARLVDNTLWSERIIEVKQTGPSSGEVVWSWSSWDHMIQDRYPDKPNYGVVADHPERLNINIGGDRSDWLHFNSVRYNAQRDEILVSTHNLSEIFVISRATTDIVYRWGNQANYKQGSIADQKLFRQHDARWLDAEGTRILIFNNGANRFETTPKNYTTVEEIMPPLSADGKYDREQNVAFGPASPIWKYPSIPNAQYFATNISGATRTPNGNTLTCLGPQGVFVEVTSQGEEVWRYVSPVGNMGPVRQGQVPRNTMVFKIYRYGPDHPALAGKTLNKQGKLEDGPLSVEDDRIITTTTRVDILSHRVHVSVLIGMRMHMDAFDLAGRWLGTVVDGELAPGTYVFDAPPGTYFAR